MQHIARRHRNSAECVGTHPENDARDEINDRSDQDLPELDFLTRIEKTCVWRLEFFRSCHRIPDVSYPPAVRWSPLHGSQPIQNLEPEESDEGQSEPRVQGASERTPSEDRGKPAEQPGQVDAEAREQGEEEKQCDHPMQKTRVDQMPPQFARKHLSAAEGLKGLSRLLIKAFNRGRHLRPPRAG